MHSLAVVLIPIRHDLASARSTLAREAAARAKLEILMLRYEQPEDQSWGVDTDHGFTCDWWEIGGGWKGWGRSARALMKKQRVPASRVPIPRSLEPSAAGVRTSPGCASRPGRRGLLIRRRQHGCCYVYSLTTPNQF